MSRATRTPVQGPPEVVYCSLCAARSGRAAGPDSRVWEVLETGVEWDFQPVMRPVRVELLRVRSLRTQQRAESQCQVITPCRVFSEVRWGFLWLIDIESVSSRFSAAIKSSTESLILAQDERWRRA